jgi:hypothetical protein
MAARDDAFGWLYISPLMLAAVLRGADIGGVCRKLHAE